MRLTTSTHILLMLGVGLIGLTACVPDPVDIEVPQAEPQLVIASQVIGIPGTPFQTLVVQVSRSFGALDFSEEESDTLSEELLDQILVDSGRVTLAYAGRVDTLVGIEAGVYISTNTEFIENAAYTLSVFDSATGLEAYAQTEVLPVVPLDSVGFSFEEVQVEFLDSLFKDTVIDLYLQFEDPAETNYYMVNAYRLSTTGGPGQAFIPGLGLGESSTPTVPYSDQLFAQVPFRDTLRYDAFVGGDTIAMTLSHISEDYYQFLTTRQRSGTSLFAQLLQEPISFPSNVDGGYGFFNMHLPSIQIIILTE